MPFNALGDDLIRQILLYLAPDDLLCLEKDKNFERVMKKQNFWKEKLRADFSNLSLEDYQTREDPKNYRRRYFRVLMKEISIPEAIQLGFSLFATSEKDSKVFFNQELNDLFPRKIALAFGALFVGYRPKNYLEEGFSTQEYFSLLFSFHLHASSDEDLSLFLREIVDPYTRDQLPVLFRKARERYTIYYFTPEVIKRAERISESAFDIGKYIMKSIKDEIEDHICSEYLSADPLIYLLDRYPNQVNPEMYISQFPFWTRASPRARKILRPLIERAGNYFIGRVIYLMEPSTDFKMNLSIAEDFVEHLYLRETMDHIDLKGYKIYQKEEIKGKEKYYLLLEGLVPSQDHKFVGGTAYAFYDDRGVLVCDTAELIPVESQIMTIKEQVKIFEIEK